VKLFFPPNVRYLLARLGQYVFAAIGILALWYWASVASQARLFQKKEAHRIAQGLQSQVAFKKTDAKPRPIAEIKRQAPVEGAAIANLAIPRIGLSTVVVEGDDDRELKLAAGHIPGTALPGEPGNIGIAAHRDTFFRPLRLIRKDDEIVLTTPHGEDRYSVVSTKIVDPNDVAVLYPTSHDALTLVTCYPFYFVGSAPKRFIVQAERVTASTKETAITVPLTRNGDERDQD
jgi:sortase A